MKCAGFFLQKCIHRKQHTNMWLSCEVKVCFCFHRKGVILFRHLLCPGWGRKAQEQVTRCPHSVLVSTPPEPAYVVGMWEETGANPRKHRENKQIQKRKYKREPRKYREANLSLSCWDCFPGATWIVVVGRIWNLFLILITIQYFMQTQIWYCTGIYNINKGV